MPSAATNPAQRPYQVLGRTGQRLVCLAEPLHGVVEPQASAWETALVKAFRNPKRRYDTRRLQVILRQNGHRVGRQHLYAAMRRRDLHALQPKAGTPPATDSAHDLRCAPNRLLD